MSANNGTVDAPEIVFKSLQLLCPLKNAVVDLIPEPFVDPTPKAVVDRLPFPVFRCQISPRASCLENPKDSIDDAAMVGQGTPTATRLPRRKETSDCISFPVCEIMT